MKTMTDIRWENKTPHTVGILGENGELLMELPKSRYAIRVNQHFRPKIRVDGTVIGKFEGPPDYKNLPDPIREDTIYIVSGITASLMQRWNFVSPRNDSAGQERLSDRSIVATRAFITFGEIPA